jgi:hypothetical protein
MVIEIRVRMVSGGMVTRHLVVQGFEVALCGRLTLRPPLETEQWAHRCRGCETALARMEEKR